MEGAVGDFYHEVAVAGHGIQDIPKLFKLTSPDSLLPIISCSPEDFPTVSVARLSAIEPEVQEKELEKLVISVRDWGMVLVTDHGIPSSLICAVKDVVKHFFGMSLEEKKECIGTHASVDNLGYGRKYVNFEEQTASWNDHLSLKVAPKSFNDELNVWPKKPTNFREVVESYTEGARKVGDKLLQALAESFSLDKNAFLKYFDPKISEIKFKTIYYPPFPKPDLAICVPPHSDVSGLTLLTHFEAGGLQVKPTGQPNWVTVPWPCDALLVIVGDLLEIMSNGMVKSAWHRAITQAHVERYSVALFYHPPSSSEIEPVKSDDGSVGQYKKVVVGDYVKHFNKVAPAPCKEATIGFAMV